MTAEGNREAFEFVAKNLPETGSVVEVGSFCGLSTILIGHSLQKHDKHNSFFTCDKWEFEGHKSGEMLGSSTAVSHDGYKKYVRDSYLRNIQTFFAGAHNIPHTIEEYSDDFFKLWRDEARARDVFGRDVQLGGPIAFCFIDGNHTFEFARRDLDNTREFLVAGGFVLLDDSADFSKWEVNRVARQAVSSGAFELVARDPNYLLRKL